MKVKAIKHLVYGGSTYAPGDTIDIIEKEVVEKCKKMKLIEDGETKEEVKTVAPVTKSAFGEFELASTELSKLNKDKLIELANSKEIVVNEELTKKEIISLILGD